MLELDALLVEFFLCLRAEVVDAARHELARHAVDAADRLVDLGLVGVGPPLQLAGALGVYERLGIGVILRKRAFWDVDEAREPAASERGRPRIRRAGVVRGVHKAHNGELPHGKGLVQVLRTLEQPNLIAQLHLFRPDLVSGKQALVRRLRPSTAHEQGAVDVVGVAGDSGRLGVGARLCGIDVERVEPQRALLAGHVRGGVRLVGGHHAVDAFDTAQLVHLRLAETHRRDHARVAEIRAVVVLVARKEHVLPRHAQARKEARAQGGDNRDGYEAPQRMGDGAHGVFIEGASHCVWPACPRRPLLRSDRPAQRVQCFEFIPV